MRTGRMCPLPGVIYRATRTRLEMSIAARWPSRFERLLPRPPMAWFVGHASPQSSILDYGSGIGEIVRKLEDHGFSSVEAFDPYVDPAWIPTRQVHSSKEKIRTNHFDCVMMNHAFEHIADPLDQLLELKRYLSPEGEILIRVPLADSYAFRSFGRDWVQLDPPRHLWLYTEASIGSLAKQAGLEIVERFRDSTAFQFWGTELVRRGLPLDAPDAVHGSADLHMGARGARTQSPGSR